MLVGKAKLTIAEWQNQKQRSFFPLAVSDWLFSGHRSRLVFECFLESDGGGVAVWAWHGGETNCCSALRSLTAVRFPVR